VILTFSPLRFKPIAFLSSLALFISASLTPTITSPASSPASSAAESGETS